MPYARRQTSSSTSWATRSPSRTSSRYVVLLFDLFFLLVCPGGAFPRWGSWTAVEGYRPRSHSVESSVPSDDREP
mgnify:CR=1 FL=1